MYLVWISIYVILTVFTALVMVRLWGNSSARTGKTKQEQNNSSKEQDMTENKNYANGSGIPMGLGMALAQNSNALTRFAQLPDSEKERIIAHTHKIHSKEEMKNYVNSLFS